MPTGPALFRKVDSADPQMYLEPEPFNALFDDFEKWYDAMISAIGGITPIFAHGYDYFAPSDTPVRFNGVKTGIGPWIFPAMVHKGITDGSLQRDIARILIERFNAMLQSLENARPLNFVFIDLRGTLDIDQDWENEIHPTRKGFRKVAERFTNELKQRLPDLHRQRLSARLVVDA